MRRIMLAAVALGLWAACSRPIPPQSVNADLPRLIPQPTGESLRGIRLGPAGREVMLGEFKLSPESIGFDIGGMAPAGNQLASGVVYCAEPVDFLDDGTLVVQAGMTWWPPGVEPKLPSRSITEGLMRCMGLLPPETKAWARATVYLRPASLPRVEAEIINVPQEGADTMVEALRHAFLFGIEAIFQARGLTLSTGSQDGLATDEEKGVRRTAEAHNRVQGSTWSHSHKIVYTVTDAATGISILGAAKADTVVEGVSYAVARGEFGALMPSEVTRGGFRLRTGVSRSLVTMTSQMRAVASPGLTCVLRTLSQPIPVMTPDGGPATDAVPGVDLIAAQKCVLTEEDQSGPKRMIH